MSDVIVISGEVQFTITLDPTVWIFDSRKIDLDTYTGKDEAIDLELQYLLGTGNQWDKELREGATPPSEKRSLAAEKQVLEGGNFGMKLAPFLDHASPLPEATQLIIHHGNEEKTIVPLDEGKSIILQFAKDGKPIRTNGPVYLFLPDYWKKQTPPLQSVTRLEIT